MGTVRTDEFRKDAARIALSSKDWKTVRRTVFPENGLSPKQIADDLGVGMSTVNKWITAHRDTDVVSQEDRELALENERLRRENRIPREERDIPKKATHFFASHRGHERHWSE
jgi:transposase